MILMEQEFYFHEIYSDVNRYNSAINFNTICARLRSEKIVYGATLFPDEKSILIELRCKKDSKTHKLAKEFGFYEVQKHY